MHTDSKLTLANRQGASDLVRCSQKAQYCLLLLRLDINLPVDAIFIGKASEHK
jgi:hypothetical protein